MPRLPRDIEPEALEFHEANPEVWRLVCQQAHRARTRGFKEFAIDMIWNVISWEQQLAMGPGHKFKMPNNYRAYYARWYNEAIGEKLFRECRLRSRGGGSYDRHGLDRETDERADP